MDLTIYTIIRGVAIGVLVSAPMGPVGILCIQRTLNKGRWSGLVTGLGAALSDLVYAILSGVGMAFVVDFISTNQNILQILGSFVLVGFGLYIYRQNPTKKLSNLKLLKIHSHRISLLHSCLLSLILLYYSCI